MRLIDAFALKERILLERDSIPLFVPAATYELVKRKPNLHGNAMRGGIRVALRCMEQTPAIDAEPVRHGEWEWRVYWGEAAFRDPPEIYDAGWVCSVCGTDLLQYLQSHFPDIPSYTECASEEKPTLERCPCCGAKMGAKEGEHASD